MGKARMLDALDGEVGSWWLSASPDVRMPGVIRRDAERGVWTLTIHGSLLGPAGMYDGKGQSSRRRVQDHDLRVFGVTIVGDVTLPMSWRMGGRSSGPDRQREDWQAFTAVLGKHAESEQRWTSTRVELPLVWDWFSPTIFEPRAEGSEDSLDSDYEEVSAYWNGFAVAAWRGTVRTMGRRERGSSGFGGFSLDDDDGFLLEDVEKPMLALQNLHDVLYGEPSTHEVQTLHPVGGSEFEEVFELPARQAVTAQPQFPDPYFGTAEVDFDSFIPAWISLHVDAEVWPSIGPPPGARSWMQTMVIESVNAAEAFARQLCLGRADPTAREVAVLQAISGLPIKTRRYAEQALSIVRDTLAQRLELLALRLGVSSATWLLGDVESWATTVAKSRNALSHGFSSREGLENDPQYMSTVLTSLKVVQRLAMLRAAGFDNGQKGVHVELLVDSAGENLIRHPNSQMARELKRIHETPKAWITAAT